MASKKEHLQKLLSLVNQVSSEPGNEWLKIELNKEYGNEIDLKTQIEEELIATIDDKLISKIYEYCVKEIIQKQATNFYQDFKILEIKGKLVEDFIRMEHFRRDNNFEDFCLALHQQIENIVNFLTNKNSFFYEAIINNKEKNTYSFKNKITGINEQFKLCELIVSSLIKDREKIQILFDKKLQHWDYSFKLKAVLYYFIFNQKIYNYYDFINFYSIGNDIYQSRNLNHRGGFLYESQEKNLDRILKTKDKLFFKFLGFLETFTTKINDTL